MWSVGLKHINVRRLHSVPGQTTSHSADEAHQCQALLSVRGNILALCTCSDALYINQQ